MIFLVRLCQLRSAHSGIRVEYLSFWFNCSSGNNDARSRMHADGLGLPDPCCRLWTPIPQLNSDFPQQCQSPMNHYLNFRLCNQRHVLPLQENPPLLSPLILLQMNLHRIINDQIHKLIEFLHHTVSSATTKVRNWGRFVL